MVKMTMQKERIAVEDAEKAVREWFLIDSYNEECQKEVESEVKQWAHAIAYFVNAIMEYDNDKTST